MPTTVVSFLGTGQKIAPNEQRSAYRTTTYRFMLPDGQEFFQTTSVFGAALINFLLKTGANLDRWIVLGTSASLWSELHRVLPNPQVIPEAAYWDIDERVNAGTVDQNTLRNWEHTLNAHSPPVALRLCWTGKALTKESQDAIAQALFDHIPPGNDVVFDISHGFRHQPVIASFIISLMRWTHNIKSVQFFSGVYEARRGEIAPVLELSICQRLMEFTEAAAILRISGNYEPAARVLGLDASNAWFLENTNQVDQARRPVKELRSQLDGIQEVFQSEIAKLLKQRLDWVHDPMYAGRCLQSAKISLDRGDYLRAIVLTYEAILIRAGQILSPATNLVSHDYREQAEKNLWDALWGPERQILTLIQWARNACAHGTRSERGDVKQILQSPEEFRKLLVQGFELFDKLPTLLN